MAAIRFDCVMQFKCCDRTGQCSDTVGQRGFTVNSRKHCHISTTDFCDTSACWESESGLLGANVKIALYQN